MKQIAILAGLAGLAAANAHQAHHRHQHVERGADGTVTHWDISTAWTTTTVTGGPANPSENVKAAAVQPAAQPAAPSGGSDDVKAAAVPTAAPNDPQAIQASLIAAQSSKNAAQQSINAHQMSLNAAHQSSMNAPAAPTQAPQPTQPAQQPQQPTQPAQQPTQPAQQPTQPAAPAPSPSGGGSTGGQAGGWHTAIGTYYGAQGGYGSCGSILSDDGHTVALASSLMGANKQYCGKQITIKMSSGQTVTATVADTCPGCDDDPYGHIDIVQGWAHQLDPNIETSGHANFQWQFS